MIALGVLLNLKNKKNMAKYIVVDVESDGELLGENSMVCFGAVLLDKEGKLDKTFYGKTKPISDKWSLFHRCIR